VDPSCWERIERAELVAVSSASVWEIEIKRASGRLIAPSDVGEHAFQQGFEPLPIGFDHAIAAGRLPLHHRDPFDRMLVAQAQLEGMTLASADARLSAYDVPLLEVVKR
jgi:PIN domain nuclease of toxin-antitoxin system